jgi:hypothetical protein
VVVLQAGATVGAFFLVDNVSVFTLGYRAGGALVKAAAAFNTVFGDFISHAVISLKRKNGCG